jgi:hypothetical protein
MGDQGIIRGMTRRRRSPVFWSGRLHQQGYKSRL